MPGTDRIAFDNEVFRRVDSVIYNTSTGQLYYDADGSGGDAGQLIATLANAPEFSATDITVI